MPIAGLFSPLFFLLAGENMAEEKMEVGLPLVVVGIVLMGIAIVQCNLKKR